MSLGERLDVVALVTASATAVVLAGYVIAALVAPVPTGAAPSPVRERILLATQPANLALAGLVLLGAAALAVRRWLNGDHPSPPEALGRLVVIAAGAVALLAVVGMFGDLLWQLQGASWGWQAATTGNHIATAAVAGLACWLALPNRP